MPLASHPRPRVGHRLALQTPQNTCQRAGHSEGTFIAKLFRNVRRERWSMHMRDLLYQRWWYTSTYLLMENLGDSGLLSLEAYMQNAEATIATGGGTSLENALAWIWAASCTPRTRPQAPSIHIQDIAPRLAKETADGSSSASFSE